MEIEEARILLSQAARQIEDTTLTLIGLMETQRKWDDLDRISIGMRANEDAQIYKHLNDAFAETLAPNIFVKIPDSQGHKISFVLGRHILEVTVVHRALRIEDIYGVDVFYKLSNWKALAFQHKKRGKNGVLSFSKEDQEQRDKIKNLCGFCSLPKRQRNNSGFLRPFCGSVYAIGDSSDSTRHVISACQMEEYRRFYRTATTELLNQFPLPPDLNTIDSMFIQCTAGMNLLVREEELLSKSIEDAFLTMPDILLRANLSQI